MKHFIPILLICLGVAVFSGCGKENAALPVTAPPGYVGGERILVERLKDSRSRMLNVQGSEKEVKVDFSMEYPSPVGISPDEYTNLVFFINNLIADGTNFSKVVESISESIFASTESAASNKNFDANQELSWQMDGCMEYADSRYVSYKVELRGLRLIEECGVYDRKLKKKIAITDLIATNNFHILRKEIRDFIKLALPFPQDKENIEKMPSDWPPIKESFGITKDLIRFTYLMDEWNLGINMEICVCWNNIKDALIDPSAVPTGAFAETAERDPDEDGAEWWRFPIEKYESSDGNPPKLFNIGTNFPYARIDLSADIPGRGTMSKARFDALQSAMGAVVSDGKQPHSTIREALHREIVKFWSEHLTKSRNRDGRFGIFCVNTEIPYRGPEYVSFRVSIQDGPPSGTFYRNMVWDWGKMRPLKFYDMVDKRHRTAFGELMRSELPDNVGDPDYVLPDYAKDWPQEDVTEKFFLTEEGVVWEFWAGEVLIGANGHCMMLLPWKKLKPFLRDDFVIPDR